jgi:hypothetical protein
MWFRIIKTKYMSEGCFLNLVPRVAHNFGKGFIRSNICLSGGALFQVRNGSNCKFWQDCWVLQVPLSIAYEDIYKMVRNSNCYVQECWVEGEWFMDFKRPLTVHEHNRWIELKNKLQGINLVLDCSDSVK